MSDVNYIYIALSPDILQKYFVVFIYNNNFLKKTFCTEKSLDACFPCILMRINESSWAMLEAW